MDISVPYPNANQHDLLYFMETPYPLHYFDQKKNPWGGVSIYYVLSSRTVTKRTPLEEFVPGASRGVLLLTVLDEGT